MQTFTAVLPTRRLLPHDLALLLAPVRAEAPSAPDAYVGRADGVLLDDGGHVVAFIVRLARELDAKSPRTLVVPRWRAGGCRPVPASFHRGPG
jgi:hypothetical protein